jgi:glycosyltransferase involved in cell wall biosynthesis
MNLRILFLAPQPFFVERGTPIAVRLAVMALCDAGHQVDLVTFHEGADVCIGGLRHFRIRRPAFVGKIPIGFSVGKIMCDFWLAAKAYQLMARSRYDVVHAGEEAVFIALAASPFVDSKLVYDMDSLMSDQLIEKWHQLHWVGSIFRWFERFAVKQSDLVLAVCDAIKDRFSDCASVGKIHVIPDAAVDPEEMAQDAGVEDLRTSLRIDGPLALYVGNLESYQGVDLLLEALASLPRPERCHLVIIGGSEPEIEKYRSRVAEIGLVDQVHVVGPRPLMFLGRYLRQADILCSPRLKGINTPMKIYSYMASGRAILATDIASHTQVLDRSNAYLVACEPQAMAAGIRQLASDAEMRGRLGSNAAKLARDNYSTAAFFSRMKSAYNTLTTG